MKELLFQAERRRYHARLLGSVLSRDKHGRPTNADKDSKLSVNLAEGILGRIGQSTRRARSAGQTSGREFESACADFVRSTFDSLAHLRPGHWTIAHIAGRSRLAIADYEQFQHLVSLDKAARASPALAASLGNAYTITPDVVVVRRPESDSQINKRRGLVDETIAKQASLRARFQGKSILHASISCKWTIRSDRAQNARAEALNLIRNRKGRVPHVVVVTGEPLPSRIASLALGTGDLDCVYHFALPELLDTVREVGAEDAHDMLEIMVTGNRLKDISDLPLDLAV